MPLPQDFILSLKANNPIEEVMGQSTTFKRSGRNLVCLCPFHSEKTPSCNVDVARQFFHCFGCGAGGDVITYVMKSENLAYIDAVKSLADRAGMTMPDNTVTSDMSRLKSRILEANRAAARFYNRVLTAERSGEKGRLYFASRELTPSTVTKYGLGYAPSGWSELSDHLKDKGFTEDELVAANLARRGSKGNIYDFFRDRAMFPIIDLRGNVIAFGGRTIDGDGPKYMNTSDTPVFRKSGNLFSLNFAKNSKEKSLILAEGYMDVISINQAGFENVVATLGTALTSEQARIISRYAEDVIIAYDSDGAGQNATMRAINLFSETNVRVMVLKIEGAKDPDEYIKKYGAARFKNLLEGSDGAVNFEFERCKQDLDLDKDEDRVEYINRCIKVITGMNNSVEQSVYISRLASEQNIPRAAIEDQVARTIKRDRRAAQNRQWDSIRNFTEQRSRDPESVTHPKEYKAECGLIAFIAKYPEESAYVLDRITPDRFVTSFNRFLYEKIYALARSEDFDIMQLQSELTADEMGRVTGIISDLSQLQLDRQAADDYINVLMKYQDTSAGGDVMTDDDLLQLQKKLRIQKG